jgi:phage FluMu protein Com
MNTVETICPYCKKANAVAKSSSVDRYGLQNIRCAHCSKSWEGNLSETEGLAKSAPVPSSNLAALRVQVRAQLDELLVKVNGLVESRAAAASRRAKFNTTGVEKMDVVNQELNKALANGKPVTFQPSESSSPRFHAVESRRRPQLQIQEAEGYEFR